MNSLSSTEAQRPSTYSGSEAVCGIYCITHIPTGRMYVGQSRNVRKRWRDHKTGNGHIGCVLRALGADQFVFAIIDEVPSEELNERERYWIAQLGCMEPDGFNRTSGGRAKAFFAATTKPRLSEAQRKRGRVRNEAAMAAYAQIFRREDATRRERTRKKRVAVALAMVAKRSKKGVFA